MILTPLENLLNLQLVRSPRARELLLTLRGQRLVVVMRDPALRVAIDSVGTSLYLTSLTEAEHAAAGARAEIEGRPLALLALAGARPERTLQSGEIQIRGDAEVLQGYRELLSLLQPDIEEILSGFVGDAAAHQWGRLARATLSLARRGFDNTVRNTAEYFAHETGDLVPRAEAEEFLSAVDRLREDVDRAAVRVDALLARLEARNEGITP